MRKLISLFLLLVMLFAAPLSFAAGESAYWITFTPGGESIFSVKITDKWELDLDGARVTGISKDGLVWFTMGYLEGQDNLDSAIDYTKERMNQRLTDIKVTDMQRREVNGMEAAMAEGTAKENGKDVIFLVFLFETFEGNVAGMAFIGDPLAKELHNDNVSEMANSVISA